MHRFNSALVLAACLTLGYNAAVVAQPISPPVQLPAAACTSSQLAASFVTGQGAAGTIFQTLALTNTSGLACTLDGFVSVQMLDAANNPLPTVGVPGGGMLGGRPGPSSFVLAPGAASQFVIAWSDVPVGGETTCPMAATLLVIPPGDTTPLDVAGLSGIAPCNSGTIDISPLRAPGAAVP
jgi:hypothetical protein